NFTTNYTFSFKVKNLRKTINYFKKLEIFENKDYFTLFINLFYPRYYIKKAYLSLKGKLK
ncbi:MAG: hypothetical protein ACRCZ2_14075, partial [Fusobacteriaceae bacterium]